jgi:hypothetical protein
MKFCGKVGVNYKNMLDNFGDYSDIHTIKLNGKQFPLPPLYWSNNDWLLSNFTDYLYIYLQTIEVDHLVFLSPFYRLYLTYTSSVNKTKHTSFWIWIKLLNSQLSVNSTILEIVTRELNLNDPTDRKFVNTDVVQCARPYRILASDVATIRELIQFVPIVAVNAIVKGLRFHGRGPSASEIKAPLKYGVYKPDIEKLTVPHSKFNDLLQFWNHPKQSSTFLKFKSYYKIGGRIKFDLAYGQGNYYSVVSLPSDKYLDNLPFANVTARDHFIDDTKQRFIRTMTTPVNAIAAADANKTPIDIVSNYNDQVHFVALNYVESTNVAICGVTAENKPILTSEDGLTTTELTESSRFCCRDASLIEKLFMIDLHPNRKLIDISADKVLKSVIRQR